MSFLNPINETVSIYSSTDASAPQINYAARTSSDVKAVLKACLVTGYGTKTGAGWTIQNETTSSARFASPSVALSNYRFGVDDSSSQTLWYYLYKNVKTSPSYNNPSKSFYNVDNTHANNGWRLLVTKRGIIFIELVYSMAVNNLSARLTYFGNIKSAINDSNGINIAFFNLGHSAAIPVPSYFLNIGYPHFKIETYTDLTVVSATPFTYGSYLRTGVSLVDITSQIYLCTNEAVLIGEVPALLLKSVNNPSQIYGISNSTFNNRPVLKVCLGFEGTSDTDMYGHGRVMLIYLDQWSY